MDFCKEKCVTVKMKQNCIFSTLHVISNDLLSRFRSTLIYSDISFRTLSQCDIEVSVMLGLVTSTDVIIQHFNQTAARRRSGEQTQNFSRNCWYSELDQVETSFLFLEFKKNRGASYYAYFIQAVSIFSIQHGYINK